MAKTAYGVIRRARFRSLFEAFLNLLYELIWKLFLCLWQNEIQHTKIHSTKLKCTYSSYVTLPWFSLSNILTRNLHSLSEIYASESTASILLTFLLKKQNNELSSIIISSLWFSLSIYYFAFLLDWAISQKISYARNSGNSNITFLIISAYVLIRYKHKFMIYLSFACCN